MTHAAALEVRFSVTRHFIKQEHERRHVCIWGNMEMRVEEQHHAWLSLLNEVYSASAKNCTLSELVLDGMIPSGPSAWLTAAFRKLLSRLKSFTLRLSDACVTREGPGDTYLRFIGRIPSTILRHITGVEQLWLRSPPYPSFERWSSEYGHILSSHTTRFPSLKSFKLENFIICDTLLEFLKTHEDTLASVVLINCMIRVSSTGQLGLPAEGWAYFFDGVSRMQPSKLANFAVEYDQEIMLSRSVPKCPHVPYATVLQGLPGIASEFSQGFPYLLATNRYPGISFRAAYLPWPAEKFKDDRAYERLQQLVKANAERIRRESRVSTQD
ncbi:hypothetical protein NLG97_g3364 [Lecanicillium saksenae]|uniref:Uncharacterized protein n=1 Tax=Lecanicillium saksenae TaxID=468837 RepID=A0ACC1R015_9HYPO|nr:hypothetical protein NLG97_g3364 [Lecanicillium saksenae]